MTIFRSSNWDEWLDLFTPGERHKTATWCEPGPPLRMPLKSPGICGLADWWKGELPFPPQSPPIDPVTGLPICCGPQVPQEEFGIVVGADDLAVEVDGEPAGMVVGADEYFTDGEPSGVVIGADEYFTDGDPAGVVFGCEDEIVDEHPDCPDLLGRMPAIRYMSPGSELLNPFWLLPGSLSSRVTVTLPNWQNRIIWMPLPVPHAVKLRFVSFLQSSFAFPFGSQLARGAVYRSRGERCGYPGELLYDLGEVSTAAPGLKVFPSNQDADLPAGELLWVALWCGSTWHAGTLDTTERGAPSVYPVIQFSEASWDNPGVAWTRVKIYVPSEEGPWPDPPDNGADIIGASGHVEPGHLLTQLPALWCLLH